MVVSSQSVRISMTLYACSLIINLGPSWPWSNGSWIYNYLCNQCLSSLMLWVRISIMARCTTLCDKVCQWLATGLWFYLGPSVSSTNKTDHHDINEILLKVVLNTIKQINKHFMKFQKFGPKKSLLSIYLIKRTSTWRIVLVTHSIWSTYLMIGSVMVSTTTKLYIKGDKYN